MNWISMKEKLPPYGKRVLVCDDTGEVYMEEREDVQHVTLGKMDWLKSWKFGNGTRLIAWMPLPKPPSSKLCKFKGKRFSFNSPLVGPWEDYF